MKATHAFTLFSLIALLAINLVGAYPFLGYGSLTYPYPSYFYPSYQYAEPYNTFNTNVQQRDVYDVQPINRHFTHERHHVLRTVHHKVYQIRDIHNVVDTYSNQDVYAYPQTMYMGSHGTPYSYPYRYY